MTCINWGCYCIAQDSDRSAPFCNTFWIFTSSTPILCRSQWLRSLRRRSVVARLLRVWVRITSEAWTSVRSECFMLLGRGLCDRLITSPEESYRLWCVVVCDLETSWMRRPTGGCRAKNKQTKLLFCRYRGKRNSIYAWSQSGVGVPWTTDLIPANSAVYRKTQ
jgi:hypothetical protein